MPLSLITYHGYGVLEGNRQRYDPESSRLIWWGIQGRSTWKWLDVRRQANVHFDSPDLILISLAEDFRLQFVAQLEHLNQISRLDRNVLLAVAACAHSLQRLHSERSFCLQVLRDRERQLAELDALFDRLAHLQFFHVAIVSQYPLVPAPSLVELGHGLLPFGQLSTYFCQRPSGA